MICVILQEYGWNKEVIMDVSERVQNAIDYCYKMIDWCHGDVAITDDDIYELIDILMGM